MHIINQMAPRAGNSPPATTKICNNNDMSTEISIGWPSNSQTKVWHMCFFFNFLSKFDHHLNKLYKLIYMQKIKKQIK